MLEAKPPGLMQPVFDPKLAAAVKAAIVPSSFHFNTRNGNTLEGEIHFLAAPVNFAFDIYVRYGGTEQRLNNDVTCAAQTGILSASSLVHGTVLPPVPATVDVVLRPSEKAARETPSFYSYWNQELVYPNVPVAQP